MRRVAWFWLACLALIVFQSALGAENQLRWKFKQGETLKYRTSQDTQTRTQIGARELKSSIQQVIEQTWRVREVAEDGTADIGLTFDRMIVKYDTPNGLLQIDTAASEPAAGELASIEGALRTLTGAEISVQFTPLGEIAKVELPQNLRELIDGAQNAEDLQRTISEEGLRSMIAQSTVVVPEQPVMPGDTWKSEKSQLGAKMVLHYKFAEPPPGANAEISTIDIAGEIALEERPVQELNVKLAQQDVKGVIHFDSVIGRLHDMEMTQKTAIDITSGESTGRQEVQVIVHTKLVDPADAANVSSSDEQPTAADVKD